MTAVAANEAHCPLPLGVHAVKVARDFVESTLRAEGVSPDAISTATLLASELVTNAVLYGYGARALTVRMSGSDLTLAVRDDAPGLPYARTPDDDSEVGRGMQVIEACARRWGVDPDPAGVGKTVWCELPLAAD